MPGNWDRVTQDVHWSMTDMGANLMGQRLMYDACAHNDQNFMGEFKNGFHATQVSGGVLANFDACATENQGRLYGIGRGFMGESANTLRNRGIPVGLLTDEEKTAARLPGAIQRTFVAELRSQTLGKEISIWMPGVNAVGPIQYLGDDYLIMIKRDQNRTFYVPYAALTYFELP